MKPMVLHVTKLIDPVTGQTTSITAMPTDTVHFFKTLCAQLVLNEMRYDEGIHTKCFFPSQMHGGQQ